MWIKNVKISMCDNDGLDNYSESEYVYKGILDVAAENEGSISTKIGTVPDADKSAKGAIYSGSNIVTSFRNYTNDAPEELEVKTLEDFEAIHTKPRIKLDPTCSPTDLSAVYTSRYFANTKFGVFGAIYNVDKDEMQLNLYE